MSNELDLTGDLAAALAAPHRAPGNRGPNCVVHPSAVRVDVCGREDVHPAEVFIRFNCGCAFTYCKHALVIIYGRVRLTKGLCPRHGPRPILEADWLTEAHR
jgi:hypothetical protein